MKKFRKSISPISCIISIIIVTIIIVTALSIILLLLMELGYDFSNALFACLFMIFLVASAIATIILVLMFIIEGIAFFKAVNKTNRKERIELKEEPGDSLEEFDNTKGEE